MPERDSPNVEDNENQNQDLPSPEDFAKLQADNKRGHEALQKLQGEVTSLKESLSAYGDVTPEKAKELKRLAQDFEAQQAGADPEQFNALLEERVAAVRSDLGSKLEERDKAVERLKAEIHEYRVTSKVMNDLGGQLNDDVRDDAAGVIAKFVRVDEDGTFFVVDENGQTRYSPSKPSQKMTPQELFKELEERKPSWFKPKGIHQGSKQPGAVIPGAGQSASVDVERAKADPEYLQSLPVNQRIKVYKELGF